MANAYIYCRVSTLGQNNIDMGHTSLLVQKEKCSEFADSKGWTVRKIVEEISSARSLRKLTILRDLIAEIKGTKAPAILIVSNISRFARNTTEALSVVKELTLHNITLISVSENIDWKTGAGRKFFRMLLSDAEYESDRHGERIREAFDYKRKKGSELGKPPYGYDVIREEDIRKFIENEHEQKVINFICEAFKCEKTDRELTALMSQIKRCNNIEPICFYDMFGDQVNKLCQRALSYRDIADLLNDYGVLKRGYTWSNNSVSDIIRKFQLHKQYPKVGCHDDIPSPPPPTRTKRSISQSDNSNGTPSKRRKTYTITSTIDTLDSLKLDF